MFLESIHIDAVYGHPQLNASVPTASTGAVSPFSPIYDNHQHHSQLNRQRIPLSAARDSFCVSSGSRGIFCVAFYFIRQFEENDMAESVYKVIELVGTSTESWEKAATAAVTRAAGQLRDLRVAEISELDMTLKDGKVDTYRAKVKVSFKYEGGD
jgi:flavin-binding protein dodecin